MEIVVLCLLFGVSLSVNAVISKWSAKKFIGIELSVVRSAVLVTSRTLAALVAGFCLGYAIKIGIIGKEHTEFKTFKLIGVLVMSTVSFFVYWFLLQKIGGKKIQLSVMVKSVAFEAGILLGGIIGIALLLSTVLVLTGII